VDDRSLFRQAPAHQLRSRKSLPLASVTGLQCPWLSRNARISLYHLVHSAVSASNMNPMPWRASTRSSPSCPPLNSARCFAAHLHELFVSLGGCHPFYNHADAECKMAVHDWRSQMACQGKPYERPAGPLCCSYHPEQCRHACRHFKLHHFPMLVLR
jgi:hypothetical protein